MWEVTICPTGRMRACVVLALGATALFVVSCVTDLSSPNAFAWGIVRSPKTGRCYEVAAKSMNNSTTVIMMSEVPCNLVDR